MIEVGCIVDGARTVLMTTDDAFKARRWYNEETMAGAMLRVWIDGRKLTITEAEQWVGDMRKKNIDCRKRHIETMPTSIEKRRMV